MTHVKKEQLICSDCGISLCHNVEGTCIIDPHYIPPSGIYCLPCWEKRKTLSGY